MVESVPKSRAYYDAVFFFSLDYQSNQRYYIHIFTSGTHILKLINTFINKPY